MPYIIKNLTASTSEQQNTSSINILETSDIEMDSSFNEQQDTTPACTFEGSSNNDVYIPSRTFAIIGDSSEQNSMNNYFDGSYSSHGLLNDDSITDKENIEVQENIKSNEDSNFATITESRQYLLNKVALTQKKLEHAQAKLRYYLRLRQKLRNKLKNMYHTNQHLRSRLRNMHRRRYNKYTKRRPKFVFRISKKY